MARNYFVNKAMSDRSHVLLHTAATAAAARHDLDLAKRRYKWPWWLDNSPYAIFTNQLREPILLVDFMLLQKAAELVLGREVRPVEFMRPAQLLREYRALYPGSLCGRRCARHDW